eukprot:2931230-Pyramimonas_sp.AAC.1
MSSSGSETIATRTRASVWTRLASSGRIHIPSHYSTCARNTRAKSSSGSPLFSCKCSCSLSPFDSLAPVAGHAPLLPLELRANVIQ